MGLLNKLREMILPGGLKAETPARIPPPRTFFLELTNHCNLRCVMCNFHSPEVRQRRDKGFMRRELAERLLSEIAEMSPDKPWVALHGAGEPLLHKDLPSILRHGASLGLDIGFLTNTMLLDRETSVALLDSGIRWIGFSIDGVDRAKFNKYRAGGDYDRVVGNARVFIEEAGKRAQPVRTMVNMTLQEEMRADVPDFVRSWIDSVDEVCVSPFRPIGSRNNALVSELPVIARIPCYMLSTMMVIFWNGDVGLCCEDWFNDGRMGNAATSSLRDIWNGPRFAHFRHLDETGCHADIPLCADCNSWYNAVPAISYDATMECEVRRTAWQSIYVKRRTG